MSQTDTIKDDLHPCLQRKWHWEVWITTNILTQDNNPVSVCTEKGFIVISAHVNTCKASWVYD